MKFSYNIEWLKRIYRKSPASVFRFLNFKKEPIVILGCGRSGTSLLLSVVSSHPEVYGLPIETEVLMHKKKYNSWLTRLNNKRKLLSFIGEVSSSANRWCEKTPRNIRYIDDIIRTYKGRVKIINIVRDGRDVICSKHPSRRGYWLHKSRWIKDVSLGIEVKNETCVYTIRYEDIIMNFQSTIIKLCDFLELTFHTNMLMYDKHTDVKKLNSFHGGIVEKLYSNAIGRWKNPEHKSRIEDAMNDKDFVELLSYYNYL